MSDWSSCGGRLFDRKVSSPQVSWVVDGQYGLSEAAKRSCSNRLVRPDMRLEEDLA